MSRRHSSRRRRSTKRAVEENIDDAIEKAIEEVAGSLDIGKEVAVIEEEEEEEEYELEDIEGVGRVTAEKLRNAGYVTVRDVAFASVKELSEAIGSEDRSRTLIINAQKLIFKGKTFMTAKEYWESRQGIRFISTGCKALDDLLGGGIETKAITEFIGEFGAGKTQLCHQLCVMVQLPLEKGGLNAKAVYIDTEGTFRPERIIQIAKFRGLDPDSVLENIIYARAYSSDHQMILVDEVRKIAAKKRIKLVVIDSLVAHFRSEYPGRENLAVRQQKLNRHVHQLIKLADVYNLAVVVTNQVIANPEAFFASPMKPAGGHIVAHGCTYRIWLRKSKEGIRIARIIDSPKHPEVEATFRIAEEGIIDV